MMGEERDIDYLMGELDALDERVEAIEKIVTKVKWFLYDDFVSASERAKEFSFREGADWMLDLVTEELSYVRNGTTDIETALDHISLFYKRSKMKGETNGENV